MLTIEEPSDPGGFFLSAWDDLSGTRCSEIKKAPDESGAF